jgi:hypothetical protein
VAKIMLCVIAEGFAGLPAMVSFAPCWRRPSRKGFSPQK